MAQLLLFPDPRPLVESLGNEFFRQAPPQPGVYLMRDAKDGVLYVGKAKNLRHRLASYRVANPDRLPRRHLRMLRQVARIELRQCADEPSALATESDLLRRLRPRFNRAGTWPAPRRFLLWRTSCQGLELGIRSEPVQDFDESVLAPSPLLSPRETETHRESTWHSFGPLGTSAIHLRAALARLLWCVLQPKRGLAGMPGGWFFGRLKPEVLVIGSNHADTTACSEASTQLAALFKGQIDQFIQWIRDHTPKAAPLFELAARETDLETVGTVLGEKSAGHSPPD